ncbi:hypothetical protein SAMN04487981_101645 [Streptomyces sp. cf386]|uniref:hypothetical protein n=1 Tax=Streptomyces sp. cf386 TaxID=1761904 RepID=UPI0008840952|nr:hypothetical protein [Streptomyces sp. cf386]SDM47576.1 hypothetical protein SAMN04487981_101645 [Streptomyces sp. cf386]
MSRHVIELALARYYRRDTDPQVSAARLLAEYDADRAQLEQAAVEARAVLAALCHDLDDPGTAALGALYLLQQVTVGTPMQPGEAVPIVYRASHESIPMGLYTNRAAARAQCEAEERRTWSKGTALTFTWTPDDSDPLSPEELSVVEGPDEESMTGYVVTPVTVASEYDPEADE